MNRIKGGFCRKRTFTIVLLLLCLLLCGCGKKKDKPEEKQLTQMDELNSPDVTIGVVSGYIFDDVVKRTLPEAKVMAFSSLKEAYQALRTGKIDAVADDEPVIRARLRSDSSITMLEGFLETSEYAFIFPKNEKGERLSSELGLYVETLRENGGLTELDEKWFGSSTHNKKSIDFRMLPAGKETLHLACDTDSVPFSYVSAGVPVGYEIDLIIGFCQEKGYGLEIEITDFADVMAGTADGRYDAGCGAVTVTEDRKADHIFGSPDYSGGVSLAVRKIEEHGAGPDERFGWIPAFRRAFLENGRYKRFFKGILTTLMITGLAILFGLPFGILLYGISRRRGLLLRGLARFIGWLLYGTPAVMLMLILYYMYYRDLYAGGVIAAVIGFTLTFGCGVYRCIARYAREAEDGTLERHYRVLAVTNKEFYQRLRKASGKAILYDLREGIILLLKTTALVGYMAVEDMTRVFDEIRKDSLETMVPLIITALAYFILVQLLSGLLGLLLRRIDHNSGKGEAGDLED